MLSSWWSRTSVSDGRNSNSRRCNRYLQQQSCFYKPSEDLEQSFIVKTTLLCGEISKHVVLP